MTIFNRNFAVIILMKKLFFFLKFKLRYIGKNICFESSESQNLDPKVAIDNKCHMADFFMRKWHFLSKIQAHVYL